MHEYRLAPIRTTDIGEYKFVSCANGGGWLLVTEQEFEAIHIIDDVLTVKELAARFPQIGYGSLVRLVELMKEQQLLVSEDTSGLTECSGCTCFNGEMRPHMIIVKITEQCNLECLYCYEEASVKKTARMSLETLCRIIDQLAELHQDEEVTIVFHGGEPLMNLKIIEPACEYAVEKYGDRVSFEMQTNATLITDDVVRLIKKYHISIGISMDGPAEVHNITRCGPKSTPSFDSVVRGMQKLKKEEIGFGVCTVINGYNYDHTNEILDFFLQYDIRSFHFLPVFPAGRGQEHEELYLDIDKIFEAFQKTFEYIIAYNANCKEDSKKLIERMLYFLVEKIILHRDSYMCMRTPCGAGIEVLAADTDGNIYICDDFCDDPEFCMGNVWDTTISEMLEHSSLIPRLRSRKIQDNEFCRDCVWQGICGGICLGQAYHAEIMGMGTPVICQLKKKLIPYIIDQYRQHPDLLGLIGGDSGQMQITEYQVVLDDDYLDDELMGSIVQLYRAEFKDIFLFSGDWINRLKPLFLILTKLQKYKTIVKIDSSLAADRDFISQVLHSGVGTVRIALLKENLAEERIVAGIQDMLKYRQQTGRRPEIQIELLFDSENAQTNQDTYSSVLRLFSGIDAIRLCAPGADRLIDREKWQQSLNKVLDTARETGTEELIRLADTPVCLLEQKNEFFLPARTDDLRNRQFLLFDSMHIGGCDVSLPEELLPEKCAACPYAGNCGFIRRAYPDDNEAKNILKLVGPL